MSPPSPPPPSSSQKQKRNKRKKKKSQLLRSSVAKKRAPVIAPAALGGSGDVACGHHGGPTGEGERRKRKKKVKSKEKLREGELRLSEGFEIIFAFFEIKAGPKSSISVGKRPLNNQFCDALRLRSPRARALRGRVHRR